MTGETFGRIITLIEETYHEKFTAERQRAWWAILEPLDDQEAMRATVEMCRTSPYPPKPAHVWLAARGDPEQQAQHEAEIAWHLVAQCNVYITHVFLDPAMGMAIQDLGGLENISGDEEKWTAREFKRRYLAHRARADLHGPVCITGIFERENSRNGLSNDPRLMLPVSSLSAVPEPVIVPAPRHLLNSIPDHKIAELVAQGDRDVD